MKLKIAKREQVKLRIGLTGPSGYGKTYSALLMAFGMTEDWSKIAIIDTENSSANLYAHLGSYNVVSFDKPYSPERYIDAIRACENADMKVIIIDSISHEWMGSGGCLEIHDRLGGRFQDWGKVTPRHQFFLDAILSSKCHVITTTRRKMDYSMDVGSNGKAKVVKHGTKEITRDGFEYELTLSLELINEQHMAKASKDRTELFMGKPEFKINSATGRKLIRWCSIMDEVEFALNDIRNCMTLEGLRHLYSKYSSLKESIYPHIVNRKRELDAGKTQVISNDKIN
jgi:hypothetical protein